MVVFPLSWGIGCLAMMDTGHHHHQLLHHPGCSTWCHVPCKLQLQRLGGWRVFLLSNRSLVVCLFVCLVGCLFGCLVGWLAGCFLFVCLFFLFVCFFCLFVFFCLLLLLLLLLFPFYFVIERPTCVFLLVCSCCHSYCSRSCLVQKSHAHIHNAQPCFCRCCEATNLSSWCLEGSDLELEVSKIPSK